MQVGMIGLGRMGANSGRVSDLGEGRVRSHLQPHSSSFLTLRVALRSQK